MRSTMQDFPLTIGTILRHGSEVHGDGEVVTATADGSRTRVLRRHRHARRPAGQRPARPGDHRRPAGRHLPVEQRRAPRGLPRDPVDGRGAAHAEHPAVPRAADLHRQPRRGQGRHRRRLAGPAAGQAAARASRPSSTCSSPARRRRHADLDVAARRAAAGAPVRRPAGRRRTTRFAGPTLDERDAAAMCYTSGTTGNPKGVVYSHRSVVPALDGASAWASPAASPGRDRVLPIVPMFHANAWGLAYAARDDRRLAGDAGPVAAGRAAVPVHAGGQADPLRRGADGLERRAGATSTSTRTSSSPPPPAGALRRLGRARCRCRRRSGSGTASTWCRPGG